MPAGRPRTPIAKLGPQRKAEQGGEAVEMPKGHPDRPEWLTGDALEVWMHLTDVMDQMGLLTRADGAIIARYCAMWVDWQKMNAVIQEEGSTYSSGSLWKVRPEASERRALAVELRAMERELGLSPYARSTLSADLAGVKGESDKKAKHFKAG